MKIAYVHTGLFPSNSPSFTFATLNAIGLAEVAEQCHFFIKRNSTNTSTEILKNYFSIEKPATLKIYQIENRSMIKTHYFFFRTVFKQIENLIRQNEIDAVISRSITFLPYLSKLKNDFNVPSFFETHDFYADLSVRTDINRTKKKRYQRLEKKYIPQITAVICLQNSQKGWYQKIFPHQKFYVARTGIAQINYIPYEKRKYITYIGSFEAHKGLEILFRALEQSTTKPHLLIIGGKKEKEAAFVHSLVEQYYDTSKTTITGWLVKAQLQRLLQQTAIGVIPLQDTFFNRYLTSPLKLFDFYSHGIPVIASDLPTTRELIIQNETGLFFQPGNPDELAQKVDILLSNQEMLKSMNKNVYQKAKQYLWKNRAKQILGIINVFSQKSNKEIE